MLHIYILQIMFFITCFLKSETMWVMKNFSGEIWVAVLKMFTIIDVERTKFALYLKIILTF